MGNKLSGRRQVVDEKYTRPQGLYQHKYIDHKKLRKLILDSKLAPCYPGDDECAFDLEECPICLLYYPSLNRSRCCTKGICTECFLQMKPHHSTCPTQCPFCKTLNYAVEYRGTRSKEEKGIEQVEEQRVIEAKIRMQQQELRDEEVRMQRRQEINSSIRIMIPGELSYRDMSSSSREGDESIIRQPSHFRQNREDLFDVDLEDLMVMEAIRLSIQENDTRRNLAHCDAVPSEPFVIEDHYVSPTIANLAGTSSSPSGDRACAISAHAESQHVDRDSTGAGNVLNFDRHPESGRLPSGEERLAEGYCPDSWVEVPQDSGRAVSMEEEWRVDHGSEVAEAGTSYAISDATGQTVLPFPDDIGVGFPPNISGSILPESFEEQMMLAMSVSLAEARARTNGQGVAWL